MLAVRQCLVRGQGMGWLGVEKPVHSQRLGCPGQASPPAAGFWTRKAARLD